VTAESESGPGAGCCPVVELRQYVLRPGQREVLVELFDREFVESQEALGMRLVGQFRDLDRPDRFVWVRGFRDMETRLAGLTAFYSGPVWKAHSRAANATMVDVDDVLLLRPAAPGDGFPASGPRRRDQPRSLVTVTVYPVSSAGAEEDLLAFLHEQVDPVLAAAGRQPLTELRTETAANTFPALPVREGEHVVVRFARYASEAEHAAYAERARAACGGIEPSLRDRLAGPVQRLRLQPTPRSRLR
jgi:hypothetical protein